MGLLTKKNMLVYFNSGGWDGLRKDDTVARSAERTYQAEPGSMRVIKECIKTTGIRTINLVRSQARRHHYMVTLPWMDSGGRILPAAMFMKYREVMNNFKSEYFQWVDQLLENFVVLRDEAEGRLGLAFNPEDYPTTDSLRSGYYFRIHVMPISDAGDFRVEMAEGELMRVRAHIESNLQYATEKAMKECWEKLYKPVADIAKNFAKDRTAVHGSLLPNMAELCQILTALNVAEDPNLELMRSEVERLFASLSTDELKDKEVRMEVGKEAEAIANKMGAFMAAA